MATKKKIVDLIAAIKTIYPYYAKETNVEILVNTWTLLFKDYSDSVVDTALLECLKVCKTPPTPADIIEQLNTLEQAKQTTAEELWSTLVSALHNTANLASCFSYSFIEDNGRTQGQNKRDEFNKLWDQLPEEIKIYFGRKGELIRMAEDYTDRDLNFEKTKFINRIPQIRKNHKMIQTLNKNAENTLKVCENNYTNEKSNNLT